MAGNDKHGKASKGGRNFRKDGMVTASTTYVRSGGPRRQAERKARRHGCGSWVSHIRGAREASHSHRGGLPAGRIRETQHVARLGVAEAWQSLLWRVE